MQESIKVIKKLVNGIDTFNRLRQQEIQIGVTPNQNDRWLTIVSSKVKKTYHQQL